MCMFTSFLSVYVQDSGGVSAGGSYLGATGMVSVDVALLNQAINERTQIGENMEGAMIGSREVPLPIRIKVAMLNETLVDNLWAVNERVSIQQKKIFLETALRDYATNKEAQIAAGMIMTFLH